tara:strand:+ start:411 stop:1271 length:861 start_codon:yes stop_codon:yes gene_type:complete
MMNKVICGFLTAALMTSGAMAQFHSKNDIGHVAVNQHAMDSAQAHYDSLMTSQGGGADVGHNAGSTIYVSEAHKKSYGASMGKQKGTRVHVWGRAIHHSDGSYTESHQDNVDSFLEQTTFSKNGTEIRKRSINLDEHGRPSEIMIYDGRGAFKYRGQQIYDQSGRFAEEQIFDAEDTLIRRKVQEYTAQGMRLPLRSWDYAENIPKDLQLVITRESEDVTNAPAEAVDKPAKQRNGLFNRNSNIAASPPTNPGAMMVGNAAPQQESTAPTEKRKGLNLGRLFSKKK